MVRHTVGYDRLDSDEQYAILQSIYKDLRLYVNFFQPMLKAGVERSFSIKMVNDEAKPVEGELVLSLETAEGRELAHSTKRFKLTALGDATLQVPLSIPAAAGKCVLKAAARPDGVSKSSATLCRRWVTLEQAMTR